MNGALLLSDVLIATFIRFGIDVVANVFKNFKQQIIDGKMRSV